MTASQLLTPTGSINASCSKANHRADRAGLAPANVRFWHKADMPLALTNVRFWGLSGLDQPLLTNLDLEYTAMLPWRTIFESRRPRPDLF